MKVYQGLVKPCFADQDPQLFKLLGIKWLVPSYVLTGSHRHIPVQDIYLLVTHNSTTLIFLFIPYFQEPQYSTWLVLL
ncbi:Versiconal hemiacetal acetate reductase [Fusarium oxysporum f. sp. albedinis]|nr:Versiconal hemiacetal acetate reductase [Fusarium oxysporum f. sp. albedinis]